MKKILLIFIFLALIFVGGFLVFKSLKIQRIDCSSQYGACNTNLQTAIYNLKSKNKNIMQMRNSLDDLLKKNTTVMDYSIDFRFPFGLNVNVIEKKAVAAFTLRNGKFALVDTEGDVLGEETQTSLPKIETVDLDKEQTAYVANLVFRLYTLYKVDKIKIDGNGISVDGIAGKQVIFPLSGDQDVLFGALGLIVSRLPSVKEASTIRVIDLRYKNPILHK